jgi:hypothetical protein
MKCRDWWLAHFNSSPTVGQDRDDVTLRDFPVFSTKGLMASSGMLRHVARVRTDVSEELSASIIRVIRIGELGTLAVTSNRASYG